MANTTWNPSDKSASVTLSGGNLTAAITTTKGGARAVDNKRAGQYYCEFTINPGGGNGNAGCGIAIGDAVLNTWTGPSGAAKTATVGQVSGTICIGAASVVSLGTIANGGLACMAVDLDRSLIWFRSGAAGNWNNSASANPATAIGGFAIPGASNYYPLAVFDTASTGTTNVVANFGDSAFTGAVPSGFTSGWPTGSATNIAAETQIALEEWAIPNAQAQVTQLAAEMWATPVNITTQLQESTLAREVLNSDPSATLYQSTLVREVLFSQVTQFWESTLAREVLLTGNPPPPPGLVGQTAVTVNVS